MSKSRSFFVSSIALALILSACAPSPAEPSAEELQQTIEVAVALTALAHTAAVSPSAEPSPATDTPEAPTAAPPSATPEATSSVVVIFTPGGLFDEAKRAEFYARLLNPFIDYYAERTVGDNHPRLVSINVQTFDSPEYPYGVDAIFEEGVYIGFLVTETGGVVNLWVPDCMNGPCPLSQDFINNYPDVAATVQAQ